MTVLVGMLCKDGVVIGSDSIATLSAGNMSTVEHNGVKKIEIIHGKTILACTGSVGLAQRAKHVIENRKPETDENNINSINYAIDISRQVIENMEKTLYPQMQNNLFQARSLSFGALVATINKDGPHLIEFDSTMFQPEIKSSDNWYVSMGSGQLNADTLLEFIRHVFWSKEQPSVNEAQFFVGWILSMVREMNTGGVGGESQIAALEKNNDIWQAKEISVVEIEENIKEVQREIKKCWGSYWDNLCTGGGQLPPKP